MMKIQPEDTGTPTPEHDSMPPDVEAAVGYVRSLGIDFAKTLGLVHMYAQRCPGLVDTHLFFRVSDLLIQSGLAASFLIVEGMRNPARRELRFLLEASVKLLFTDQSMPTSPLDYRLVFFERKISASGLTDELKGTKFDLLPGTWAADFVQRVLRHYGHLSGFVHASHNQIRKHIAEQAAGLRIGFDTTETIVDAASDLFDTCEMSLVACLHAIGPSLAGDLMVAFEDMPWVFHAGRFVAALDSTYDYKVERQQRLVALQTSRSDWVDAGWRAHYIRPTGV